MNSNSRSGFRSRAWSLALIVLILLVSTACYPNEPNLTETGKGRPVVDLAFPEEVEAGERNTLTITIDNPGPGDMPTVVVAFALVGPTGGAAEIPTPLVGTGIRKENPAIYDIEPLPKSVSPDAVVFVFDALPEGETRTIDFVIVAPQIRGVAANSVTVYDGADPERAIGGRLETTVR